jgi:hypothetical protein
MQFVGTVTDHKLGYKIPWMRGTRGRKQHGGLNPFVPNDKMNSSMGMQRKSAGPSIFKTQARMGVGRTPIHMVEVPTPAKKTRKKAAK